jgi:hypothetical protein
MGSAYYRPKTNKMTVLVHRKEINTTIFHLNGISHATIKQMQTSIPKHKHVQ